MAVRKNKRISKGDKKKAVDPFLKKYWFGITAPSNSTHRNVGKTLDPFSKKDWNFPKAVPEDAEVMTKTT